MTTKLMKDAMGIAGMAGSGHKNLTIGISAAAAFIAGTAIYVGVNKFRDSRRNDTELTGINKDYRPLEEVEVVEPDKEEAEK